MKEIITEAFRQQQLVDGRHIKKMMDLGEGLATSAAELGLTPHEGNLALTTLSRQEKRDA